MRPWLRTILKVVVMGVTMCSGITVPQYDVLEGDGGYEGGRDIRQTPQDLDRAA